MRNSTKKIATVMTIAGSDSGGGAGIQADLKTIAALGGYGTSVITALTAQNTLGVNGIFPVPTDFVGLQFDAILSDFNVKAIKTGMLLNSDIISYVAILIRDSGIKCFVLDPVMVATSGDKLSVGGVCQTLLTELIPLATIITPNIYEAELLLGRSIATLPVAEQAAKDLLGCGCRSVIVKGGHLHLEDNPDEIVDIFAMKEGSNITTLCHKKSKIITNNLHGTGCTFSAALATLLASGYGPLEAFYEAQKYIENAIHAGANLQLGKGHGPLWHFNKN